MLKAKSSDRILNRRGKLRAHGPDRRTHRRVNIDVYMNRFLDGQPYMCRMVDISRTGARLVPMIEPDGSRAPHFMGQQFQLPDRDVEGPAESPRRRRADIGVDVQRWCGVGVDRDHVIG